MAGLEPAICVFRGVAEGMDPRLQVVVVTFPPRTNKSLRSR